jgi:acetyl-CoA carboxylase biotin carboxylase subunit
MAPPPFRSLLVANRGEIACRIMRTAKRLGMRTIGVYSEPDARAPHVAMADEAICIGSAASADSYLRIDRLIDAIKKTGAEAVHPGYGFLSERAAFCEAVEAAGAAFVGPTAHAIRAMGDKIESKLLAQAAGVSTIPGVLAVMKTAEEAVAVANKVGYPVMLKASAGGGGKGMRIAYNDAEAASGFALSAAEAAASFGDDRIFVERYVEKPRHVEIQLIADTFGNTVYLPPRDCSIQRRNQKVVEEAPAPHLSEATVRAMGEEAVALAKAVGYRSAGTVEFLVDAQQRHYFLEMNTRLQVEHPVTEMVTGLDLVEVMLQVAARQPLPFAQADVLARGWSFECRVYAEDPLRGFLPSVGTLARYVPPDEAAVVAAAGCEGTVRVDDGVVEGGEISVHYDPMIAKLITHGASRDEARRLMLHALARYQIRGDGLRHNLNFLHTLLDHPRFARGEVTAAFIPEEFPASLAYAHASAHHSAPPLSAQVTTAFIPEEFPDGYDGHVLTPSQKCELLACAAALELAAELRATAPAPPAPGASLASALLHAVDSVALSTNLWARLESEGAAAEQQLTVTLDPAVGVSAGTLLPPGMRLLVQGAPATARGSSAADPDESAPTTAPLSAPASAPTTAPASWSRLLTLSSTGLGPGGLFEARAQTLPLEEPKEGDGGHGHEESDPLAGGTALAVQVLERRTQGWLLSAFGTTYEVLTRAPRVAELSRHMKPPPRSLLDNALLSPMPGKLVSVAVSEGQVVFLGQALCVVEAMKMQNVLTARRDGVVRTLLAQPGAILSADQPIIVFDEARVEQPAA